MCPPLVVHVLSRDDCPRRDFEGEGEVRMRKTFLSFFFDNAKLKNENKKLIKLGKKEDGKENRPIVVC
jgi:hypothetical protein